MNVRRWDKIVTSWAAGDQQGLDDAWPTEVLPDLGSQWGQYEYVTNIGFAVQRVRRITGSPVFVRKPGCPRRESVRPGVTGRSP
ncbi:hypothetical protein GCM10009544_17280 [Streptomyces stramineus]|uniref:Uncharacterized protein n=1 Tax=Streptomyces stramineus TaxID=173861 RepID=A0ABP3JKV1_9ACTN